MTHRRKLLLGFLTVSLLCVAVVGWWWYARFQSPPFKIVLRGSSSSDNNLRISGGNLVVVAPKPGVLFGTVRKPDRQEEITYLILFRYGHPKSDGSNQTKAFRCTSDGRQAETNDSIDLAGKRIEAVYRIELDETGKAIANESLTIGGKSVEIASGQVFLIDMTAETPVYQQKKVELPAIHSRLESTQDVEQLVEKICQSLERQDSEIKAFLQ